MHIILKNLVIIVNVTVKLLLFTRLEKRETKFLQKIFYTTSIVNECIYFRYFFLCFYNTLLILLIKFACFFFRFFFSNFFYFSFFSSQHAITKILYISFVTFFPFSTLLTASSWLSVIFVYLSLYSIHMYVCMYVVVVVVFSLVFFLLH